MINRCLLTLYFSLAVIGLLCGCSKKTGANNQAFEKAPPEIKAIWDQAVADDQANNYVSSITEYRSLMAQRSKLTGEQLDAVNTAALAINQRLYAAANNGDAAAKVASQKLAAMQNQR